MELMNADVAVRSTLGVENATLFTLDPVETKRAETNGVALNVSVPEDAVAGSVAVVV
jgi:hypothetical protein